MEMDSKAPRRGHVLGGHAPSAGGSVRDARPASLIVRAKLEMRIALMRASLEATLTQLAESDVEARRAYALRRHGAPAKAAELRLLLQDIGATRIRTRALLAQLERARHSLPEEVK